MNLASKDQTSKPSGRKQEEKYFPISPLILRPDTASDFRVYLKQGDSFVLYTREKEQYTQKLKQKLFEFGITTVYVPKDQSSAYESYIQNNFESILNDPGIPLQERSRIFYSRSLGIVQGLFDTIYNKTLEDDEVKQLEHLVKSSLDFLSSTEALNNIGRLVSHDYKTYSHCLHVFTYSASLMHRFHFSREKIIEVGIGAMLHDIGKSSIPKRILNKPGKLSPEEWEAIKTHPVQGLGLCALLSLSHTTINAILLHHEKCDGSGYPCGLKQELLPLEIRILTCCDIYDAITSDRPYAKAESTYNALNIMRYHMQGALDLRVFREFVIMLSDANLTSA